MKTIKNFKEITFELLEKENHFIISEESGNYEIKNSNFALIKM